MTASGDTPVQIIKSLKLQNLVAIATMAAVIIVDVGFIAVDILKGATVDSYVYLTAIVMTSLVMMVFFWTTGIVSGANITASASLNQVTMTNQPVSGINPMGLTGTNLTANDLAAVNNLIAAGKLQPSILTVLSGMSSSQIQAILSSIK